jgi:hypothetical protein
MHMFMVWHYMHEPHHEHVHGMTPHDDDGIDMTSYTCEDWMERGN